MRLHPERRSQMPVLAGRTPPLQGDRCRGRAGRGGDADPRLGRFLAGLGEVRRAITDPAEPPHGMHPLTGGTPLQELGQAPNDRHPAIADPPTAGSVGHVLRLVRFQASRGVGVPEGWARGSTAFVDRAVTGRRRSLSARP